MTATNERQAGAKSLDYYDVDALGSGRLKTFLESRRRYEAIYVTRTMPEKSGRKLEVGTAIHLMLLQPHLVDKRIAVIPPEVLGKNGARNTNAWRDWEAEHAGMILLTESELQLCQDMAGLAERALEQRGLSVQLCDVEEPHYWTENGLSCKSLTDILTPDRELIVDVKTTEDTTEYAFNRVAKNLCYGLQTVHYERAILECYGVHADWNWLAVPTAPPFVVRWYGLEDDSRSYWKSRRQKLMEELKACHETGDFAEAGEGQVVRLTA